MKAEITKIQPIGEMILDILKAPECTFSEYINAHDINKEIKKEENRGRFTLYIIKSHIKERITEEEMKKNFIDFFIKIKKKSLINQSKIRIKAVIRDFNEIKTGKILDFGSKEPHFGNGGVVNAPIKNPKMHDAVSLSANFAELFILSLKDKVSKNNLEAVEIGIYSAKEIMDHCDSGTITNDGVFRTLGIKLKNILERLFPNEEQVYQYCYDRLGDIGEFVGIIGEIKIKKVISSQEYAEVLNTLNKESSRERSSQKVAKIEK